MKFTLFFACLAFLIAGCAHPLESLMQERHQERIDASNANQPLTSGAGDGLGKSFAQSQMNLSLRAAIDGQ